MSKKLPRAQIAIITRTKNRPLLLRRAMQTILAQTHSDWLHVIVNDGGAAEPLAALQAEFQTRYGNRLVIVHNATSRGMDVAANIGIAACDSEFVTLHDDDDSWHPDFLARTTQALVNSPLPNTRAVLTQSLRIDERIDDEKIIELARQPYNPWLQSVNIPRLCASNVSPPIALLFQRSLIGEIGGFDENSSVLCDWDYMLRIALTGEILVIPEMLAHYHHRPDATGIDANTVLAQQDLHQQYRAVIINRWARREYADGKFSIAQAMTQAELNREIYRSSLETLAVAKKLDAKA